MFKSLIASVLLTASLGTPLIQITPKKAVIPNTLYGMYCFRDEFLIPSSTEYYDEHIYDWGNYEGFSATGYFQYSGWSNYITVRTIELFYDGTDIYNIFISYGEDNVEISGNINVDNMLADFDERANYTTLFFPTPVYVDDIGFEYFKCFFTGSGNQFVSYYNGYYYMNRSTAVSTYYQVYGNFIVDNNIYNDLVFYDTDNKIEAIGNGGNVVIYENNAFKISNRNVLIQTTLIPLPVYNKMTAYGAFAYVQPTDTNTFGDLIFSIMDAPIYYLTSLFSFELFGIQFYVAFMSVVTLLLIVVVVRKVI